MNGKKILVSTLVICLTGLIVQYYLTNFWIGSKEDYENLIASNGLLFKAKKALGNIIIAFVIPGVYWLFLKFGFKIEAKLRNKNLRVQILFLIMSAMVLPFILH
jgi:hypothetical protein